jgi:uncharacterized membrane protein
MWTDSVLARYKIQGEYIVLVVLVVLGLALRLHEIHYSLDGDEVFSVKLASKQFAEVISGSLQDTPHPPLHLVLLHLWMKAFGVSEASARSLSVLFSAVFLWLSYRLLRRFVSPWLALGVLSIVAVSPWFVYYGQQARPYSLVALLSTANVLAFIRVLERPGERRRVAAWTVSSALLLYAQYLGVLLIAFQIGFAVFYLQSERRRLLAYGSLGFALIVPWVLAAMGGKLLSATNPLPTISWIGPPAPTDLVWFYVSVFGEAPGVQTVWLAIILAVLGAAYVRHAALSRNLPAHHLFLFLLAFGLPAVVYVISVLGPKPVFASRQMLGAAVAFILTLALCMATLPKTVAAGFWLILLAWTAAALPTAFPHNTKPPWRDVATKLDGQYASVPVVAQERWVVRPLMYYRTSGSVRFWRDLGEKEKTGRLLFACRTFRCSDVEAEALQSRLSLVASWRWGSASEDTGFNQVFLYEIGGLNEPRL